MRIGVVTGGDAHLVRRIDEAIGDEVERATNDDPRAVLDANPSVVVAPGEAAVTGLVRAGVSVPILPVGAGPGLESVPESDVELGIEDLLAEEWTTRNRPLLSASVGGNRVADALFDATLVTSEPARISEYSVRADGEFVDQFRADATVVATPAGSRGYARNAGGPVVQLGTEVVSVVPVAPFAIHVDDWVLRDPVTLAVERDEDAVVLLADDREVCPVEPHEPVEMAFDGTVELASVDASRSFFA
ncbi:ATP-NAD kinase [Haladaptatus salinisoli]|uniref:ATP-NAD kinase n=1 Tax=Haladaptatus salinisoli TaxID=2884876 RepID=UPI001D0A055A|nr:ATP-NAD kinase [Haladaptatus salinisoli]